MVALISHRLRLRQLLDRLSWLRRREAVLILGALALAVWLVAPALVMSIVQAFRPPAGNLFFEDSSFWGLSNFADVYTGSRVLQSTLIDTGIYTVGSVALAFVLGFTLAWLVERTNLPGRDIIFVVLLFPLMMPAIVTTLGWVLLLGQRVGLINIVVRTMLNWIPGVDITSGPFNLTTMYGMVVLQGFGSVTLMFIFISAALRGMDPALEEASRASGATFLQTVRKVTIPVIRPAVLGVIILSTILTIESFEVPLILSTGAKADILSTRIWELLTTGSGEDPLYGAVAAMGFHFMLLTYVMFFAYTRLTARAEQFATITGKGFRARRSDLGRWRWPVLAAVIVFLLLISFTPFAIMVYTSFLPVYIPPSFDVIEKFTLNGYAELFDNKRFLGAVTNTVVVALVAPTISVLVALITAWMVVRARSAHALRVAVDLFTSSSLAIPAVVAAFAFFIFYLWINRIVPSWLPLHGTIVVLILVYAFRMALAYRLQRAGVTQIARELEEVSATSGAGSITTFRRVLLPLVAPSIFGAWLILFLIAFREFTLAQVLTAGSEPFVISTLVYNLRSINFDQASALSVLTVAFLFLFLVFLRVFVMKRVRAF